MEGTQHEVGGTTMYRTIVIEVPVVQEPTGPAISCAKDLCAQCGDLEDLAQECFILITMDVKNRRIDRHMVSLGSLTESLVHPREVFRHAILDNAASIAVAHNHPSGDPSPGSADVVLTHRIKECADLMGFRLLDHIIVGKGRYYSFAESGSLGNASVCDSPPVQVNSGPSSD